MQWEHGVNPTTDTLQNQIKHLNDLFEDMRLKLGLQYISDLPLHAKSALTALKTVDLEKYTKEEIVKFVSYVSNNLS